MTVAKVAVGPVGPLAALTRRALLVCGASATSSATSLATSFAAVRPAAAAASGDPPELLLARDAGPEADPSGHLVSEKYDGVRAFWDGRQLLLRGGGTVKAPTWFTAALPPQPLDGELWLGRGRFDELSGIVRKGVPSDGAWRPVKYMVFELPGAPGSFAQRSEQLRALVARLAVPHLVAVEQARLADRAALQRRLDEVVQGGGEGLVLHRADAPYTTGRSETLLKLKPFDDADAVVIAYQPGKGKHTGRLGALIVRTAEGLVFQIGTGLSDAQRDSPPPLGATVTYRHRGLTPQGLPRFASLLRQREPGW